MSAAGARLVELAPDDVLGPARSEIQALWLRVWPQTPPERFDEILPRHASRRGFRFVAARDDGELAGMAYGYLGGPGQWWHDRVAAAMTEAQRRTWLRAGHFEVVELMVDRARRRRGLGRALHDHLLGDHVGPAVLSTQVDNTEALALYRALGWQVVVPEIDLGGGDRAYCVLAVDVGRASPAPAALTATRATDLQPRRS